jgi:hypothetical protein
MRLPRELETFNSPVRTGRIALSQADVAEAMYKNPAEIEIAMRDSTGKLQLVNIDHDMVEVPHADLEVPVFQLGFPRFVSAPPPLDRLPRRTKPSRLNKNDDGSPCLISSFLIVWHLPGQAREFAVVVV